ncbi:MAG: FtsX-like permease family protein [Azoarcus sp.]|nr:FtsX-like permease family protein [Azoarcus sp.]
MEGNINENMNIDDIPRIFIGKELARSLKAHIGSNLTIMTTTTTGSMNAMDVVVSAIITTGWHEADKRLILLDIKHAQRLLMTDKVNTLSIYLFESSRINKMQENLLSFDADKLATRPWSEQAFYYASVKALYNRIFGLLGIIIMMLVLFSVANTLSSSVIERTREIGTFRALGSHPYEIITQFVHEGMLIGVFGILIGNMIALIIASLLPYFGLEMPPPPGRSIGYPLLVSTPLFLYMFVDMLIVSLCCIAAFYSSRKAVRMQIMEALRHV